MPNPTIVSASLDDKELKQSIANLVAHVKRGLHTMLTDTNSTVDAMEKKLKSLGDLKIGSGGSADGGASKRAKAQNAETDAVEKSIAARDKQIKKNQEVSMSFDQTSAALQKASRGGGFSVMDTYNMQIELLKNKLRDVRQDIDIFNAAIGSGKKTQIEWGQQGLKQANAEAEKLMRIITTLENQRGNLANVLAPQGHTIQNYVNSLQKANPELAQLNEQFKRGQSLMQNGGLEAKKMSSAITNGSNQSKEAIEALNKAVSQTIRIEQERRGAIRQTGLAARETADQLIRSAHEQLSAQGNNPITGVKELTAAVEQMRRAYFDMSASEKTSPIGLALEADIKRANDAIAVIQKYNKTLLFGQQNNTNRITNEHSLSSLRESLKTLTEQYNKLTVSELNAGKGDALIQHFQDTTRAAQILQRTLNRPVNLKAALSGDERTLDDIAYKMQRLRAYKQGIDLTKPNAANEIKQVDEALVRLQKDADKWMSKSQEMIKSNTALGRSWNYMKNRLAFYFTIGTSTAFVKNLIEIRSQYEMNERALGILIDSAERGSQIFNELSSMALVSPYTLIELSSAAKQLTAYDIAAKDVVDTTRRLADMAAAVGIPIERLTYALGQIKAYGYLNARDARMFANAGIPLVKQLADHYTELEGRLVSTADVYDRIKKKAIDYSDVMQVINKMTDEGGKFYDFQAKMADTLKVQLANLTLAWNNMLNDIGESYQGILVTGINATKELFLHWQQLSKIIYTVAGATGAYIAYQLICNQLFGKGTIAAIKHSAAVDKNNPVLYKAALSTKKLTAEQAKLLLALNKNNVGLRKYIVNAGILTEAQANAAVSSKAFGTSLMFMKNAAILAGNSIQKMITSLSAMIPELLPFVAIGAVIEVIQTISDRASALSSVNETIAKNAKESAESIKETLSTLADSGVTAENATKLSADEQKKAWDEIRNAIEMTAAASNTFITSLLKENPADRISKGIGILEDIKNIHEIMALWHDDTVAVTEDFKILGIGSDGLSEDMKDFVNAMNKAGDSAERLHEMSTGIEGDFRSILSWIYDISDILSYSGTGTVSPIGWLKNIGAMSGIDILDPRLNKMVDAYMEVNDEIKDLSDSLMRQLLKDNVQNVTQIQEVQQKAINSIAQEKGWSEQQTMNARLLLEQKFAESSVAVFRESVADRSTAWNEWMKYLTSHHKTEFTKMGDEEISVEQWSQDKRKKLYENTFEEFKKYNALAAQQIKDSVNDLSQLAAHIKVYYDEQNQPSWLEKDFKKRLPSSTLNVKEYKSVTDLIGGEQKALKDANEEIKRLRAAGVSELDEHFLDVKNRANQATEALDAYNAEHEKETKKGKGGSKKDPMLDTLKQTIDVVKKLQSEYDTLTKNGLSSADALDDVRSRYSRTISFLNRDLQKFGLPQLGLGMIKGKNPNDVLKYFQQISDILTQKGLSTLERQKAIEVVIQEFSLKAKTFNLDMITKGLNNELGKLKEEYELAVELDANPELGDMFADMFGINTSTLPKTFGDALDRAQIIINRKLAEMNITTPFDLMESNIDSFAKSTGLDKDSAVIKELVSAQNAYRDMFKKNITETEKMLDDYIKKYGDYSDKIAEIEASRLEKLKKLNEAYYTEEMRKRPEYVAKLNAIEQGASKEKQQVDFDEFKNSRYYTMMFENLDYISTKTIRDMRDRVRELMDTMNDLTPEQLKTLMSQYEKLEQKLVKRSPFKTLTKDLKEYFSTSKERKAANQEFKNAQKEYDAQKKNVAALKEKYEQAKANSNTSQSYLDFLQIEINSENEILKILKEQLEAAQKKADKYNLTAKLAKSEALAVAQVVGQNLQSLGELRDFLQQDLGIELSDELNGLVDGLSEVGQGINKITSSATSGDIVGVITGVGQTIYGLYDGIASIFGGGSTSDKKITKQIQESERAVKQLELAYVDLQQAVDKAYGTAVIGAKQATLANKKLQLAELQRQIQLEKSRDSKNRDEDKIIDLQKQYRELFYEIQDGYKEIVDDLMGTDVASFAENLVSSMIDAFKQGEDYMKVFGDKFDEMIDNMIMKSIVSRVVAQYLDNIWESVDSRINERSKNEADEYEKAQQEAARRANMSDAEILNEMYGVFGSFVASDEYFKKLADEYRKAAMDEEKAAKERLDAAAMFADSDIDYVMSRISEVAPELGEKLKAILGQYYTFGETSDKQLSGLQQGISQISETTANALEAYMNGVSQQVYYHSSLLEQIRDSVVGLDLDVSLGVQSQMLLQLQNSYQTQQAIQQILEGVLVPSGRAFAVELLS